MPESIWQIKRAVCVFLCARSLGLCHTQHSRRPSPLACHNVQVIYIFNLIKIQIEKKQQNEIKENLNAMGERAAKVARAGKYTYINTVEKPE